MNPAGFAPQGIEEQVIVVRLGGTELHPKDNITAVVQEFLQRTALRRTGTGTGTGRSTAEAREARAEAAGGGVKGAEFSRAAAAHGCNSNMQVGP